jgi:AAA domain
VTGRLESVEASVQGMSEAGTLETPVREGLSWGMDARPLAQAWLLRGFFPRGCAITLEGRKGTGKSTIAASVVAALTGGPEIPGWEGPTNGRAVWLASEESWEDRVAPRLRVAGAHMGRVCTWQAKDNDGRLRRPVLPDDLEALQDVLWQISATVLVLDPYTSLANRTLDLLTEQAVRAYLEPLQRMCEELRILAILLRHLKKGLGGDAREAGRGSGAVTDVVRAVLRCDEHPHEQGINLLSCVAINFGKRGQTMQYKLGGEDPDFAKVEWCGTSDLDSDTIAEGRGNEADRDEWSDADRLLCSLIGKGWVKVEDLNDEAFRGGITPRMLRRAKARLRIPSRRRQIGRDGHWEWGAPEKGWPAGLAVEGEGGGIPVTPGALGALEPETTRKTRKKQQGAKAPPCDGVGGVGAQGKPRAKRGKKGGKKDGEEG